MKPPSGLEQYESITFPPQQPAAPPLQQNNSIAAASDEITSANNNLVQEQLEARDNETVENGVMWKLVPVDLGTTDSSDDVVQASQAS